MRSEREKIFIYLQIIMKTTSEITTRDDSNDNNDNKNEFDVESNEFDE